MGRVYKVFFFFFLSVFNFNASYLLFNFSHTSALHISMNLHLYSLYNAHLFIWKYPFLSFSFIVESGMAIGKELSVDHFHKGPRFHLILTKTNGEGLFTMKAAYIPHPIHQIAMIDFGNMPMRLCSPISLSCASLLAHRTGFMPHEVRVMYSIRTTSTFFLINKIKRYNPKKWFRL